METGNVDVVLNRITASECNVAAEELARCLDPALPVTDELLTARELLAAFLNDLNNECLARWGPQVEASQAGRLSRVPRAAGPPRPGVGPPSG
jgi:hypothetical protein